MAQDSAIRFPHVTSYHVKDGKRVLPVYPVKPPKLTKFQKFRKKIEENLPVIALPSLDVSIPSFLTHRHTRFAGLGLGVLVAGASLIATFTSEDVQASTSVTSDSGPIIENKMRVTVGQDGDLKQTLFSAGMAPGEIDRFSAEMARNGFPGKLTPGLQIDITYSGRTKDDAYKSLKEAYIHPKLETMVHIFRANDQITSKIENVKIDKTPQRITGKFEVNTLVSLMQAGVPEQQAREYLAILAAHVDTDTLREGDRFDIAMEQQRAETGEVILGKVIYVGLYQVNGINLQLSQWTIKGKMQWFDAQEAAQPHDNIQRPVPGVVSSNYGPRMHPILGYTRMHKGMDFKAGYGTPILAVQTGWVTKAGWGSGYGKQVELQHGAGLSTTYSHMSRITVDSGTLVKQGEVIGYVGDTGLATGPHLHWEVHRNGQAINPSTIEFTSAPRLKGSDLAGYLARLNAILRVPFSDKRRQA
jgi:murein DD-endopeptidase MepM/ murein hydrolase activator NlpD